MGSQDRSQTQSPEFDLQSLELAFNGPCAWSSPPVDIDIYESHQSTCGAHDNISEALGQHSPTMSDCSLASSGFGALEFDLSVTPAIPLYTEPCQLDCSDGEMSVSGSYLALAPQSIQTFSSHQKLGPLSCSVCKASFGNRGQLEMHAKRSGHTCFVCPYDGCDKSYNRRDVYSRHKKGHQEIAGFVCTWCFTKPFKRKDHLQQHKRTCQARIAAKSNNAAIGGHRRSTEPDMCSSTWRSSLGDASSTNASIKGLGYGYANSAIRDIVEGIGNCLGDGTEDALRSFLNQVKSQQRPRHRSIG